MTKIQMRRDTAALWTSNNPTLSSGEIGYETDNNRFKIGDGITNWNSLSYYTPALTVTDIFNMINSSAQLIDDNNIADTIARKSYVTSSISGAIAPLVNTNDSRLSDARTPLSHIHNSSDITNFDATVDLNSTVSSSALHIVDTANPHSVTAAQVGLSNVTNDTQLKAAALVTTVTNDDTKVPSAGSIVDYVTWSNVSSKPSTFAPASHTHGNITNAGAIGSTTSLPIITTTGGVLTTGTFGSGSNTFCVGNDSRLSNARAPTSHNNSAHSETYITVSAVTYETLQSNGDIGSGSGQVASGSHIHDTIDGGSPADYLYINIDGGSA